MPAAPALPLGTGPVVTTPSGEKGIPYVNSDGEIGVIAGQVTIQRLSTSPSNWVQRVHPLRSIWQGDEVRQRSSFLGDRKHLIQFLVPHRFEGKKTGVGLDRSRLGYGIGLNKAYLHEVFGHIRGTPAHYTWGPLGPGITDSIVPPTTGQASTLWYDCTGDGVSWTAFFESRVLEWILTSVGGFILVDSNRPEGIQLTQAMADSLGIRATLKWIPMSWVEDYGRGPKGYRWVKISETEDVRQPKMTDNSTGYQRRHLLYELMPDGRTMISRFDDDGNRIGPVTIQKIVDTHGRGILPLIEAKFGEHPDMPNLGSGLLMGLDDIVIDLFNLLTEIREAYRDEAFGFLTYRGSDADGAYTQVTEGSRWVNIGDDPNAELNRVAADSGGVASGITLFDIGLKNWSLSAKRRAMEIMEASSARSGLSLKAEFQLDLRPLLVAVTETLDLLETNAMFVLSQIEGNSPDDSNKLLVKRETEFQLEQEASRIARIVGEFLQAIPAMPKSLLKKMIERWASSIDFLNLEEKTEDGVPLGEAISDEADEIATAAEEEFVNRAKFSALSPGGGGGGGPGAGGRPPTGQPGTLSSGGTGGEGGTGGPDLTGGGP